MQEPVLVTGGAGYIGSHVCKVLAREGFFPITYDNLSTGHAYAVKWGPLVVGDLHDSAKLDQTFSLYKPKAVLHFAASALVVESTIDPAKYYRNNVAATLSLLEAMRRASVSHLIFSSSCATYGHPCFIPITEQHPQAPINPYGRTKWMIEQMLDDFETAYGFRSMKLRYFNAAGADLDMQIGEDHTPETHLIPSVILSALYPKGELSVYGTDFPTKDGSAIRDYIHVQDLAEAHMLALKHLLKTHQSAAINLGTGNGHSILEIIEAIQTYCGKSLSVRIRPRRNGEPGILIASANTAKEILGWTPQKSDLHTLIDSSWKWHCFLVEHMPLLRSALSRLDEENAVKK